MALSREQKKEILDTLSGILDADETVTFVRFNRLPVKRMESLRDALREEGVSFQVIKKSLLEVGLNKHGPAGEIPDLPGQIALSYGGDGVTASARGVYQFETDEEAGEELEIVGGIFKGEYKEKDKMMEIAQIPGADELRGMFVNAISSPVNGLAVTLNERAKQLE